MHTVHERKFFTIFLRPQVLVQLFSIFLVTQFLDGVSYTDDTTPDSANKRKALVIKEIE